MRYGESRDSRNYLYASEEKHKRCSIKLASGKVSKMWA
nr:MAG TPA: hypothetical protein [Caudoviricetes sp.]